MRLVNNRFSNEAKYFWDERAATLEIQSTLPIQDHGEMGHSGQNGDPSIQDMMAKIQQEPYYNVLFSMTYGDSVITENRIQLALAQFIRSIQSFDAKYDDGRANAPNDGAPFSNFTGSENQGKSLFLLPPQFNGQGQRIGGGLGCGGCHQPPEFTIDPNTLSNAVFASLGGGNDFTNTKSPSLRDLFDQQGNLNGPLMHDGSMATIHEVIMHYNNISFPQGSANLVDPRLRPQGNPQNLQITSTESGDLINFLKTLTGSNIYSDPKWSNPFDAQGNLTVQSHVGIAEYERLQIKAYPNPATHTLRVEPPGEYTIFDVQGRLIWTGESDGGIDVSSFRPGTYLIQGNQGQSSTWIKQ